MNKKKLIKYGVLVGSLVGITIWIIVATNLDYVVGLIWIIIGITIAYRDWIRFQEEMYYKSLIDNIYVLETDPKSGLGFGLPTDLDELDLVRFVHKSRIVDQVKFESENLTRYRNKFFTEVTTTNPKRIIVFPIWFRDGQFVNEEYFGEEKEVGEQPYQVRAIQYIRNDRRNRHMMIKSADPAWYEKYYHQQKTALGSDIRKWIQGKK